MKKKLFSYLLCLTIVAVMSTAIDCGCAYAQVSTFKPISQEVKGHCDRDAKQQKQDTSTEDCCVGCQLEHLALGSTTFNLQIANAGFSPQTSNDLSQRVISKAYDAFNNTMPSKRLSSRGVSDQSSDQPIYISLRSLLV